MKVIRLESNEKKNAKKDLNTIHARFTKGK